MRVGTALGYLTLAAAVLRGMHGRQWQGGPGRNLLHCHHTLTGRDDQVWSRRWSCHGSNGKSCTVTDVDGGTQIECEDGTSSFVASGTNGTNGKQRCPRPVPATS